MHSMDILKIVFILFHSTSFLCPTFGVQIIFHGGGVKNGRFFTRGGCFKGGGVQNGRFFTRDGCFQGTGVKNGRFFTRDCGASVRERL